MIEQDAQSVVLRARFGRRDLHARRGRIAERLRRGRRRAAESTRQNPGADATRLAMTRMFLLIAVMLIADRTGAAAEEGGGNQPEWRAEPSVPSIRVETRSVVERGVRLQRFRIVNSTQHEWVRFQLPTTPSMLHDELAASVRIHSTIAGIQLALNVVLPNQNDPRTNAPLETLIPGIKYRNDGKWQQLAATGTPADFETQLRRVRTELHRSDVMARGAYVSGLVLMAQAPPGEFFLDIAESDIGPIVPLNGLNSARKDSSVRAVSQTESPKELAQQFIPMRVELNHILLNDQPVVLRFAPDHGEPFPLLQKLGLNAVWLPDVRQSDRAQQAFDAGLAILATPPHPEFEPGDYKKLLHALPPLEQLCPHASAWYMGTRITPDQLPHLLAWSREIRSADRQYRRLQIADVTSAEGAASREIDLVGIGKHIVGREESFGELRNQLYRRQRGAGQLAFPWTWIQTEPTSHQQTWRHSTSAALPHVEPEQILQQVCTVISAGSRGIGFWKTRPLQPDNVLDQETLLAIELASLELELLEPFIANGRIDGHLLMQTPESEAVSENGGGLSSIKSRQPWVKSAVNSPRLTSGAMIQERPVGPDAAVISSGGSMLILVSHWDQESQYVAGPMFERELNVIVAATETSSAWLLTSTGIRALPREVTAGGLKLRIQNFDRYATIVVSSDTELIRRLEQQTHQLAARAAPLTVELAATKYRRVLKSTEQLREFGAVPTVVSRLLSMSDQWVKQAEHELSRGDYADAVRLGNQSLRALREVQQSCWREATRSLTTPSAAPHTIAFSTLPDHWKMMQQIQQRAAHETANLLPAGNFENLPLFSRSGWKREAVPKAEFLSTADNYTEPGSANSVLRLAAWLPSAQMAAANLIPTDVTPLIVTSPAMAVQGGDIVRIKGRLRRGRTVPNQSKRPVLLFDSEMGPENGMRLSVSSEWDTFEMLRETAPQSTSFHFSIALTSMAEVHVDDLSVTRLPQRSGTVPPVPQPTAVRLTGGIRDLSP